MTATVLYGLKQCSTCVKARNWLDEHHVAHTFIDYRDHPIDAGTLNRWASKLGGWEKLVNRASLTWRNLDASRKSPRSQAEWTALIKDYPALVRRPVAVSSDGEIGVGFNEQRYEQRFA